MLQCTSDIAALVAVGLLSMQRMPFDADPDISPLGHARQSIKIKQGIKSAVAKEITGFIRDGKFKVTTQIQGDEVRVNSKSRDDLQAVIAAVRAKEFPVAVQFVNFRE